jgi:diketogulonate reductase-like aldo/keto reductase
MIGELAQKHGKTPAQVMLRRHLQQGRSVIPKSTEPGRFAENITSSTSVLRRRPRGDRRARRRVRGGLEPEAITLESSGRAIPED